MSADGDGGSTSTDLAPIATDLVEEINREYDLEQADARSSVEHGIRCGKLLLKVKKRLPRGQLVDWIRANCRFSVATAYNRMKVARTTMKSSNALELPQAMRHLYRSGRMAPHGMSQQEFEEYGDPDSVRVISFSAPALKNAALPAGFDPREFGALLEVLRVLHWAHGEVKGINPRQLYIRGATEYAMERVRPVLKDLHLFVVGLREMDALKRRGLCTQERLEEIANGPQFPHSETDAEHYWKRYWKPELLDVTDEEQK